MTTTNMNIRLAKKFLPSFVVDELSSWELDWKADRSNERTLVFIEFFNGAQNNKKLIQELRQKYPKPFLIFKNEEDFEIDQGLILEERNFNNLREELVLHFYPRSPRKIFGITGTNGKTTTAHLVKEICRLKGMSCLSIGTLGVVLKNGETIATDHTTPPYIELAKHLHRNALTHDVAVLEVSSHALHQKRLGHILLDAAAWTNITQDHLDYHHSMEEYFLSKCRIARYLKPQSPLYIMENQGEINYKLEYDNKVRVSFLQKQDGLPPFMQFQYNLENYKLASSLMELSEDEEKRLAVEMTPPPGRVESIHYKGSEFIVDYAHTPDALLRLLKSIRETFPERKMVTLFGCGGDRDKKKRPQMGHIAEVYSHEVIVTSDNPRNEDPSRIMDEIMTGVEDSSKFILEADRKAAIELLVRKADDQCILVVAGKGHEEYQEVKGVRRPFSDIGLIKELLK